MLTIKQKAVVTAIVVGLNLLVLVLMGWFVVVSAVPSLVFLGAVLTR